MIKKIFLSMVVLLLLAYLVVAVTLFNRAPADRTCQDVLLVIKDTADAGFVTKEELKAVLHQKGIYPIGRKMSHISTQMLEKVLDQQPLIADAECYKTVSGKICIEVTQRIPLLRVMSHNGENYYIDQKGKVLTANEKCVAHRVVATGAIEKSFAMNDLYKFGVFLQNNKFWNAQIEQINVLPDQTIELVPRVGSHIIYLGKLDGFEDKLARLKEFYAKALNQVGWNKYSRINLEFSNQIICTKKEEK